GVAKTYSLNAPISDFERSLAATTIRRNDGSLHTVLPTNDPIAVQLINYGLDATGVTMRRGQVAGTPHMVEQVVSGSGSQMMLTALRELVRNVRGDRDMGQIMWGNLFSSVKRNFIDNVRDAGGVLTGKQEARLDDAMQTIA